MLNEIKDFILNPSDTLSLHFIIGVCIIHFILYFWLQIVSQFVKLGSVRNSPNPTVNRLRTEYKVNIRTFQKNGSHYGFAWFQTIFLNESLFRNKKRLEWCFHHEHYHVMNKHRRNVLLHRVVFSLTPVLLLFFHPLAFWVVYISMLYFMYWLKEKVYEKNANVHANKMMGYDSSGNKA